MLRESSVAACPLPLADAATLPLHPEALGQSSSCAALLWTGLGCGGHPLLRCMAPPLPVAQAFIDTLGDPGTHRARLSERFPSVRFTVEKKADSRFPIVSAASIVAKVIRDRSLQSWAEEAEAALSEKRDGLALASGAPTGFAGGQGQPLEAAQVAAEATGAECQSEPGKERNEEARQLLGSGYPADPDTKAWLAAQCDAVFGFPPLVRFSWATSKALMEERCVAVHWGEEACEAPVSPAFKPKRQHRNVEFESCAAGRHVFFRSRKLQVVENRL